MECVAGMGDISLSEDMNVDLWLMAGPPRSTRVKSHNATSTIASDNSGSGLWQETAIGLIQESWISARGSIKL